MIRLLISGEGSNELGSRCRPEEGDFLGDDEFHPGVMEKLFEKVRPGGWEICSAFRWKDIRKLKVRNPGLNNGDFENVRRLALKARESGCNAVVFLRDRDRQRQREKVIERAANDCRKRYGQKLMIVDGIPVEMLESWLLALTGEKKSEDNPDPAGSLREKGVPEKKTTAMVQLAMNAKLSDIPDDAVSLRKWLRKLAQGLNQKVPKNWP